MKINGKVIKIAVISILMAMLLFLVVLVVNKTMKKDGAVLTASTTDIIEKPEEVIEEIEDEEITEEENKETTKVNNKKKDEKNTKKNTVVSNLPYFIRVNYGANTITIYTKDENGEYTVPVKAMICSTGRGTPRSGQYKTKNKWTWKLLFGNVWGQYSTHITGNILFHSVPYLKNGDHNSLEYWEYDKLGTACSAGCVRLKTIDAKWIYENCAIGTIVEFYSDSNPGPLRKTICSKSFME